MSCRIPRLTVGWAPQVCAAVIFGTVLCTPAPSYTHYCCAPDSHPIPQARLPRLHGQFEPVLPVERTTKAAGLPDYIKTWGNVYTMRSCVHDSSLMESSKSSPLRFHCVYQRFRRMCVPSGHHKGCCRHPTMNGYGRRYMVVLTKSVDGLGCCTNVRDSTPKPLHGRRNPNHIPSLRFMFLERQIVPVVSRLRSSQLPSLSSLSG